MFRRVLGAHDMSGIVAHNLSGLRCRPEVTDETDRMASGDPEDAIRGSVWKVDGTDH
jgi:hypothetical protein